MRTIEVARITVEVGTVVVHHTQVMAVDVVIGVTIAMGTHPALTIIEAGVAGLTTTTGTTTAVGVTVGDIGEGRETSTRERSYQVL